MDSNGHDIMDILPPATSVVVNDKGHEFLAVRSRQIPL